MVVSGTGVDSVNSFFSDLSTEPAREKDVAVPGMEAVDDVLSQDPSLDWLGVFGVAGFEFVEVIDAGGVGNMDHTGAVGATGLLRLQSRGNVSTREFSPD